MGQGLGSGASAELTRNAEGCAAMFRYVRGRARVSARVKVRFRVRVRVEAWLDLFTSFGSKYRASAQAFVLGSKLGLWLGIARKRWLCHLRNHNPKPYPNPNPMRSFCRTSGHMLAPLYHLLYCNPNPNPYPYPYPYPNLNPNPNPIPTLTHRYARDWAGERGCRFFEVSGLRGDGVRKMRDHLRR